MVRSITVNSVNDIPNLNQHLVGRLYQTTTISYLAKSNVETVPDDLICNWRTTKVVSPVFNLANTINEAVSNYRYELAANLRRIRRKPFPYYLQKLESEHGECYVYLAPFVSEIKCSEYEIAVLRINELNDANDFRVLRLTLKGDSLEVSNPCKGSLYFGGTESGQMAEAFQTVDKMGLCPHSLWPIIIRATKAIRDNLSSTEDRMVIRPHSNTFMSLLDSVRNTFETPFERLDQFYSLTGPEIENFFVPFDIKNQDPVEITMDASELVKYPRIELTAKEIEWVHNYAFPILNDNMEYPLDEAVTKCPYGNKFRICPADVLDGNGNICKHDIYARFTANEDGTYFGFLKEILSPGLGICAMVLYRTRDAIPVKPDAVKISMLVGKGTQLPSSPDILKESVLVANKQIGAVGVVVMILETLIAIHDRPRKYTTLKVYKEKEKVSAPKKRQQRTHAPDEEIVVHILKPALKIRQEVQERKATDEPRKYRYVVSEWDVVEHVRRLKSGKTVFVRAHTCKRHAATTPEPKVLIKL